MARIILYFNILLVCVNTISSIPPESKRNKTDGQNRINTNKTVENDNIPQVNAGENVNDSKNEENKKGVHIPSKDDETISKIDTVNSNVKTNTSTEIESGAVVRGIFVFMAITLLFIIYIAFKTYSRRNKTAVIKKYGVRTRRTDLEMEPLPLEEDEEDETVFDLGSINNR